MSIWASHGDIAARDYTGSHRYPSPDDPPAEVCLAHIPTWHVPGHQDSADDESVGPWLRLDVDGRSRWVSVVLDEDGARALRDDLDRWLRTPKVEPEEGDQ